MALEVVNAGSGGSCAKVYNVTGSKQSSLPDWVVKKNRKHLKKDAGWTQRVDLIQDFEFPEACNRLKQTPDKGFIVATGVYKPQMRVFDLRELAMKFDRHTSAETVQFHMLSDDWKKVVMLQSNRYIEFHTQFGMHFSTRIPKHGRDLAYHEKSCDLFAAGASPEIYRVNLEQGTFVSPWATQIPEINVLAINPLHDLVAAGGLGGAVEFFGHRCRSRVAHVRVGDCGVAPANEISCLRFLPDGLSVAVGTDDGRVLLFDMRSAAPLLIKDHQYGLPIRAVHHHPATNRIVSADSKSIKIWSAVDCKQFSFVEPPCAINDVLLVEDSGLLMVAPEDRYVQSYFIPALGPAPKWCSFLESMTEELEQSASPQTFDNFKFVTPRDLQVLGLEQLVGTPLLKPYMHGFFVPLHTYERARAVAADVAPLESAETIKQKGIDRRMQEQASSRVSPHSLAAPKPSKINRNLQQKLQNNPAKGAEALLSDSRFKDLFHDPDFAVDESSFDFRLHNPSSISAAAVAKAASSASDSDDSGCSSDRQQAVSDGESSSVAAPKAPRRPPQPKQTPRRPSAASPRPSAVRMTSSASLKESALLKSKRSFGELLKKK